MSEADDKKARLEAIRAANRAKQAEAGDSAPAAQASPAASAPAATSETVAPAVADAPADDKKAKLEAIRAANRAKQADAGGGPAAAAPAAAAPAAAAPARPAAPAGATRPAPKAAAQPAARDYMLRAVVGALSGLILCVGLATMTGNYMIAGLFGLLIGAATGVLTGSWPPTETTGD